MILLSSAGISHKVSDLTQYRLHCCRETWGEVWPRTRYIVRIIVMMHLTFSVHTICNMKNIFWQTMRKFALDCVFSVGGNWKINSEKFNSSFDESFDVIFSDNLKVVEIKFHICIFDSSRSHRPCAHQLFLWCELQRQFYVSSCKA